MAKLLRTDLYPRFVTGAKPTQADFANLIESVFFLREDTLPISKVTDLPAALNAKANVEDLNELAEQVANLPAIELVQEIGDSSTVAMSQAATTNMVFDNANPAHVRIGKQAEVGSALSAAVAIGETAEVQADEGTALGYHATVYGERGTAVGYNAVAGNTQAAALGSVAEAQAPFSTAVGAFATATAEGGTALGLNSTILAADVEQGQAVSVGSTAQPFLNKRIINVANGVNPTDAATVGQVTSASEGKADSAEITRLDAKITEVDEQLDELERQSNLQWPTLNATEVRSKENAAAIAAHNADKNNPHSVTKTQVGLNFVDNTADTDKPLSTAQQSYIDARDALQQARAEKGINGGYAPLDAQGFVPDEFIRANNRPPFVFDTLAAAQAWLQVPANVATLVPGDDFYFEDVNTPDYWWTGAELVETKANTNLTNYYSMIQTNALLEGKATKLIIKQNHLVRRQGVGDGEADSGAEYSVAGHRSTIGKRTDGGQLKAADPIAADDLTTKKYVDDGLNTRVPIYRAGYDFGDMFTSVHFPNQGMYRNNSKTGMFKIALPVAYAKGANCTVVLTVHDSGNTAMPSYNSSTIMIGFQPNSLSHNVCSIVGGFSRKVRLALEGTQVCVLLGDVGEMWGNNTVFLDSVKIGAYSNAPPASYIDMVNTTTGLTNIVDCVKYLNATHINGASVELTTFTPTIGGSTTNPAATYTRQVGEYIKVGKMCYVNVTVEGTIQTAGTGAIRVSGFPVCAMFHSGQILRSVLGYSANTDTVYPSFPNVPANYVTLHTLSKDKTKPIGTTFNWSSNDLSKTNFQIAITGIYRTEV